MLDETFSIVSSTDSKYLPGTSQDGEDALLAVVFELLDENSSMKIIPDAAHISSIVDSLKAAVSGDNTPWPRGRNACTWRPI